MDRTAFEDLARRLGRRGFEELYLKTWNRVMQGVFRRLEIPRSEGEEILDEALGELRDRFDDVRKRSGGEVDLWLFRNVWFRARDFVRQRDARATPPSGVRDEALLGLMESLAEGGKATAALPSFEDVFEAVSEPEGTRMREILSRDADAEPRRSHPFSFLSPGTRRSAPPLYDAAALTEWLQSLDRERDRGAEEALARRTAAVEEPPPPKPPVRPHSAAPASPRVPAVPPSPPVRRVTPPPPSSTPAPTAPRAVPPSPMPPPPRTRPAPEPPAPARADLPRPVEREETGERPPDPGTMRALNSVADEIADLKQEMAGIESTQVARLAAMEKKLDELLATYQSLLSGSVGFATGAARAPAPPPRRPMPPPPTPPSSTRRHPAVPRPAARPAPRPRPEKPAALGPSPDEAPRSVPAQTPPPPPPPPAAPPPPRQEAPPRPAPVAPEPPAAPPESSRPIEPPPRPSAPSKAPPPTEKDTEEISSLQEPSPGREGVGLWQGIREAMRPIFRRRKFRREVDQASLERFERYLEYYRRPGGGRPEGEERKRDEGPGED